MKQRKTLCRILAFVLSLSLLVGCGNNDTVSDNSQGSSSVPEQVDENQAAAEQLLLDLKGTYQELWPVVLADEYQPYWLEVSTGIVGEENAQSAVDMMQGMINGFNTKMPEVLSKENELVTKLKETFEKELVD